MKSHVFIALSDRPIGVRAVVNNRNEAIAVTQQYINGHIKTIRLQWPITTNIGPMPQT